MLEIIDLHVEVDKKPILRGVNLHIKPGETHVLFGPNGSGKSTLVGAIIGIGRFRVTEGKILFRGQDITALSVHERANLGIGIAFQRPPVLRGVSLADLLKISARGRGDNFAETAKTLNLDEFLPRDVNYGFSGGEVKRSEMLQLVGPEP